MIKLIESDNESAYFKEEPVLAELCKFNSEIIF
jgi:hypothetical protein